MYAIWADMCNPSHVFDMRLLYITPVTSIRSYIFAVSVFMYHSSHVCDKSFYVPLESQEHYFACLM